MAMRSKSVWRRYDAPEKRLKVAGSEGASGGEESEEKSDNQKMERHEATVGICLIAWKGDEKESQEIASFIPC